MSLLTVEQALQAVLSACAPCPSHDVAVTSAAGCALAHDVKAEICLPAFDNSAVDGYAVRSGDIAFASDKNPIVLPLLLVQAAGSAPASLPDGGCARVLTGGPVPDGADTIVMQEDVTLEGSAILFSAPSEPGQHIRYRATDIAAGDVILRAGQRLGAAEIAALTAVGCAKVPVTRLPKVAVVTTGDEVKPLLEGSSLPPGSIYNSNAPLIAHLLAEAGIPAGEHVHLPDDLEQTTAAFQRLAASGYDAIVCAGGVSVGDRDFVKPAIEAAGKLAMWRVALKPGKPLAFGNVGSTLFFGLPGNPASVLVTFELFVRPALLKLAGQSSWTRPIVTAELCDPITHDPGRREYVRAMVRWEEGRCRVETTGAQGSGRLQSLCGANALVIVPEDSQGYAAGDSVQVLLMTERLVGG
jgi:molybdopterin molybdotransferase